MMPLNSPAPYTFSPALAGRPRPARSHPDWPLASAPFRRCGTKPGDPRLVFVDGQRWLVATYRSLQNREFPFLDLETVSAR